MELLQKHTLGAQNSGMAIKITWLTNTVDHYIREKGEWRKPKLVPKQSRVCVSQLVREPFILLRYTLIE